MDSVKRTIDDAVKSVNQSVQKAKEIVIDVPIAKVNATIGSVYASADATAQAFSDVAQASVSSVGTRLQRFVDTGVAHSSNGLDMVLAQYQTQEDVVVEYLKGGVRSCILNPYPSAMGMLGLSVLLLPGPRGFLIRNTIGNLQTDEAIYRGADTKLQNLIKSLGEQAKEGEALEEVAVKYAKEKFAIQHQLRDTTGSMQTLAKEAWKAERQAEGLKSLLRQLPGRQALQLRSELAKVQSTAGSQRAAVVRSLNNASKALKS